MGVLVMLALSGHTMAQNYRDFQNIASNDAVVSSKLDEMSKDGSFLRWPYSRGGGNKP